jgi:hypothetical protein
MRNRRIMLLLIGLILSIAMVIGSRNGLWNSKPSMEDSLITSMNSTKAQVMESTISAWAKINGNFMTADQLTRELAQAVAILHPEESTINIKSESSDGVNRQTLTGSMGSKYYNIQVESVKTDKGGESYALMDVSINSSSELAAEKKKVEAYYQNKKIKAKISSCVIGVYEGKLTENEMRSKIADAMNSVKAKEVEGLSEDALNSISAFSGNINNFVLSNNKKVNMQIAMRYSSYDDKTYIWIGSPLINVEY